MTFSFIPGLKIDLERSRIGKGNHFPIQTLRGLTLIYKRAWKMVLLSKLLLKIMRQGLLILEHDFLRYGKNYQDFMNMSVKSFKNLPHWYQWQEHDQEEEDFDNPSSSRKSSIYSTRNSNGGAILSVQQSNTFRTQRYSHGHF